MYSAQENSTLGGRLYSLVSIGQTRSGPVKLNQHSGEKIFSLGHQFVKICHKSEPCDNGEVR